MKRGYQYDFSTKPAGNYDVLGRQRKAKTMVAVLGIIFPCLLMNCVSWMSVALRESSIVILPIIFSSVVGIDIDEPAIERAMGQFQKDNLVFHAGRCP